MDVKLMTYNIMHGLDYNILKLENRREINLDKIIAIIKSTSPDIISLNEVYNDINHIETCEEVKEIATALGYNYYNFGKAITLKNSIEYGNGIISKYPISNFKLHHILDPQTHDEKVFYEHRVILDMDILVNDEKVKVLVTHFGLAKAEQENAYQMIKDLINLYKNQKIILMGDFNITMDNELYKKLTLILDDSINVLEGNSFTFNSYEPFEKIDYIFTKNIKTIKSEVINYKQSDHFPLILKIMM